MVYNILLKTFRLQQLPTGQVSVLCAPRGTSHYIHSNAIITVFILYLQHPRLEDTVLTSNKCLEKEMAN